MEAELMKRIGRSILRKVYLGILLCIFILFVLSIAVEIAIGRHPPGPPGDPLLTALSGAFWIWLIFGRHLAYRLIPLFVSTLSCPGCGEEIDAVDVWDCACGYHDYRERHILSGGCPSCGEAV